MLDFAAVDRVRPSGKQARAARARQRALAVAWSSRVDPSRYGLSDDDVDAAITARG